MPSSNRVTYLSKAGDIENQRKELQADLRNLQLDLANVRNERNGIGGKTQLTKEEQIRRRRLKVLIDEIETELAYTQSKLSALGDIQTVSKNV